MPGVYSVIPKRNFLVSSAFLCPCGYLTATTLLFTERISVRTIGRQHAGVSQYGPQDTLTLTVDELKLA